MVAARALIDMIDGIPAADTTPQEIVLLPKLKIRASCGKLEAHQYYCLSKVYSGKEERR